MQGRNATQGAVTYQGASIAEANIDVLKEGAIRVRSNPSLASQLIHRGQQLLGSNKVPDVKHDFREFKNLFTIALQLLATVLFLTLLQRSAFSWNANTSRVFTEHA
ncbi:hypothetical protein CC78DRAFT_579056 [Lojkania enalia]|uniref:Uncharacterized protein n=1 Tax=Lojkania enalia TaxID=147567 RepID=A0A9P4KG91_9PLEO|nr:hypothetical protein CC78DRAFT_579056 [Didymosphaeria enalia]